ncbi:hypothetical protein [Nocardia sp. CA-119907]|uniref:hypothetical protein n=1 Tax=Nocardia sp. CA-119907 TaxID=3239973 RepID=UPI003D959382
MTGSTDISRGSERDATHQQTRGPGPARHTRDRGRYVELDGYTLAFETLRADVDATPLFQGLPEDRCQCAHWGYVVSVLLTLRHPDRDQQYRTGDACYAPPAHTPIVTSGTDIVEFSPTAQLRQVMVHSLTAQLAHQTATTPRLHRRRPRSRNSG